jgi:hypothetical protein
MYPDDAWLRIQPFDSDKELRGGVAFGWGVGFAVMREAERTALADSRADDPMHAI